MHAGRDTASERRHIERRTDALFVHGMAGFVQCREQCVAKIALVDAGGDADVACGKSRAERVMREVEPAALDVIAEALCDMQGKIELCLLRKHLAQTRIVGRRLVADRIHDRHEFASQLAEHLADRRCRHALVGVVDVGIGDVLVGREERQNIRGSDRASFPDRAPWTAKSFAGRARVQAS